ncbi:MAG: sigma-54-dependent transcriptional regulator, partial [Candidatus Saccharimonadales bacterium]
MPKSPQQTLILIADDDRTIRANLAMLLSAEGYQVREAENGRQAAEALAQVEVHLVLLDLKMPEMGGLDLLRQFQGELEETPVIVITAFGGSQAAIEAMKLGAFDYITKPFDLDEVLFTVRRALTQQSLIAQVRAMELARGARDDEPIDDELLGRTPAMLEVFKTIGRVAATDEPVLILGESGTGKELVASALHTNSPRCGGPFIKVNCAALSTTLLESELFGHERGAFTGATERKIGKFEQAHQGTLMLDEIGEMSPSIQAKFLRVLEGHPFERVGGSQPIKVDVRVIAATNRDLEKAVAETSFRRDLYFRLRVVEIFVPPLRKRPEDIIELANYFLDKYIAETGRKIRGFT